MVPTPPVIETVVVQPTPFCNIDCTYCYLPNRRDRSVMSRNTLRALFECVFASGWAAPSITVIWHAGEPLVLPATYYHDAFELIETLRPPHISLRHSIQTNGMLISDEYCELFRNHHVGIGVSIDGPRHLHDAHRRTRSGRGTFDRTMAGIRLLQRHGVEFHVITVLSRESLDDPEALVRSIWMPASTKYASTSRSPKATTTPHCLPQPTFVRASVLSWIAFGAGAPEWPLPLHPRDRRHAAAHPPPRGSGHGQ